MKPFGVSTLHNVCAVHRGGGGGGGGVKYNEDIQYTIGIHDDSGGYHEYTGGYYDKCGEGHWESN